MNGRLRAHELARAGLMLALLCATAPVSIPMPFGVPLTLQSAMIMITAMCLSLRAATMVVLAYLGLGALGLPVFSNGQGGLAVFAGPTGGYLIGFLVAVTAIRLLLPPDGGSLLRRVFACIAGMSVLFATGLFWLVAGHGLTPRAAFLGGCLPFLPLTALKIAFAVALVEKLPALQPPQTVPSQPCPGPSPSGDAAPNTERSRDESSCRV